MTYQHDHPDSDLFNEKTLGDYLSRKAPWPCVVIGGEYGNERPDSTDRSPTDSQGSGGEGNR